MKNPRQVYKEENQILPDTTCDVKQRKDWLSIFQRALKNKRSIFRRAFAQHTKHIQV